MPGSEDELVRGIRQGLVRLYRERKEYARDVIGNNISDFKAYKERLTQVFQRFDALSDHEPVEIVQRGDDICKACHMGLHCKKRMREDYDDMQSFVKKVRRRGLGDNVESASEEVIFQSDSPKTLRKLRTTAGTVRQVLRQKLKALS